MKDAEPNLILEARRIGKTLTGVAREAALAKLTAGLPGEERNQLANVAVQAAGGNVAGEPRSQEQKRARTAARAPSEDAFLRTLESLSETAFNALPAATRAAAWDMGLQRGRDAVPGQVNRNATIEDLKSQISGLSAERDSADEAAKTNGRWEIGGLLEIRIGRLRESLAAAEATP
jgi:hypothetical protein